MTTEIQFYKRFPESGFLFWSNFEQLKPVSRLILWLICSNVEHFITKIHTKPVWNNNSKLDENIKERGPQDSNLCGQSPSDFESDSLTTRTEPPRESFLRLHSYRTAFLMTSEMVEACPEADYFRSVHRLGLYIFKTMQKPISHWPENQIVGVQCQ